MKKKAHFETRILRGPLLCIDEVIGARQRDSHCRQFPRKGAALPEAYDVRVQVLAEPGTLPVVEAVDVRFGANWVPFFARCAKRVSTTRVGVSSFYFLSEEAADSLLEISQ